MDDYGFNEMMDNYDEEKLNSEFENWENDKENQMYNEIDLLNLVKINYKRMRESGSLNEVVEGVIFTISDANKAEDGITRVKYGNRIYKIQGTKRIKVTEEKKAPKKAKSEAKPATTVVKCENCKESFERYFI